MIARTAACAAWLFAWSVCAEIHGGGLSFTAAASAVAQEIAQERVIATLDPNIVEGTTQVARRQDADVAAPSAGTEPSPVNQVVFPQPALTPRGDAVRTRSRTRFRGRNSEQMDGRRIGNSKRRQILARCRKDASSCPLAAQRFLAIVDEGRVRSGRARIGVINRAINLAIIPTSDLVQWGVVDRWSAPLETFTTRRGDCEDYARQICGAPSSRRRAAGH
jgi:predicted transglutaminase-like cysteine proteinase